MACTIFWLLLTGMGSTWGRNVPETAGNDSLSLAILAPVQYMQRNLASFSVALEEVKHRQLLPYQTIDWKFWDTNCNPLHGKTVANKISNTIKTTCLGKVLRVCFYFSHVVHDNVYAVQYNIHVHQSLI